MPGMAQRGGEFAPLAAVGLRAAGVPARRAREIEAQRAWTKVAGHAAARRVTIVGLFRGVLVLEAADRAWIAAMRPHIPRLARALAREFPRLGVKKLRVRLSGGGPEDGCEAPTVVDSDTEPDAPR
jgi:hypothetical protein